MLDFDGEDDLGVGFGVAYSTGDSSALAEQGRSDQPNGRIVGAL